ncbi:MAG: SOS response-associated peptidase [Pelolinea sp.]|nr:SOS response-associated peptidase [Pelolinea sp.]
MCGRFTITLEPAFFQQELDLGKVLSEWTPRYNTAPSQNIPVVLDPTERDVEMLRWGLIPHWAKDPAIGNRMINARSETIQEKPSFRAAFKQRRCLILADGFYEWQKPAAKGSHKVPYYFQLTNGAPFAFAGIWEAWQEPEGDEVRSCSIITCPPNELVAQAHDRMPVILDKTTCWNWLSEQPANDLQAMLAPYPAEKMHAHPVGLTVNNPRNDSAECVRPLSA